MTQATSTNSAQAILPVPAAEEDAVPIDTTEYSIPLTMEIARGASRLRGVSCMVITCRGLVAAILIQTQGDRMMIARASDGRLCNAPVSFEDLLVTQEDALRCIDAYARYQTQLEAAREFAKVKMRYSGRSGGWGAYSR